MRGGIDLLDPSRKYSTGGIGTYYKVRRGQSSIQKKLERPLTFWAGRRKLPHYDFHDSYIIGIRYILFNKCDNKVIIFY